jgi:hypothetical protein
MTHEKMGEEIARKIAHGIAKRIAIGIALLFGFAFFVVFGGFLVQWLWNWLITDLFALRRITIWEALGLLALSRIMFGSFGGGRGPRHHKRDRREWWEKRDRGNGAPPSRPAESLPA